MLTWQTGAEIGNTYAKDDANTYLIKTEEHPTHSYTWRFALHINGTRVASYGNLAQARTAAEHYHNTRSRSA